MGRAAAIAYTREGADVAINYFPTEEPDAREVIALIRAEGRKPVALPGDLREEAFCKKLVADAVSTLGGLDILVSNAARQQWHSSILDIPTDLGRPGQPAELASIYVQLAANDASFATGQVYGSSGGSGQP